MYHPSQNEKPGGEPSICLAELIKHGNMWVTRKTRTEEATATLWRRFFKVWQLHPTSRAGSCLSRSRSSFVSVEHFVTLHSPQTHTWTQIVVWDKEVTSAPLPRRRHRLILLLLLLLSDTLESIHCRWIIGSWSVVRVYNCFDTCRVINEACCDRVNKVRQTNKKKK